MADLETRLDERADVALRHSTHNDNQIMRHVEADLVLSERAKIRADEIGLIRNKLATSSDGHITKAATKLLNTRGYAGHLPDVDFKAFRRSVDQAVSEARLDRELAELEREYRSRVQVVGDLDPYAEGSPESWIADCLAVSGDSTLGDRANPGAEERLARHGRRVAEAVSKRSAYGQWIERQYGEQFRSDDPSANRQTVERNVRELRSGIGTGGGLTMSASGGGAASFIPPEILTTQFVEYRSPDAAVLHALDDSIPLPQFGMTAYIPNVTGPTTIQTDTEGAAPTETDPTMGLLSGPIVQKVGVLELSQVLIDRAGPGISGDVLAFRLLKSQLDAAVDSYAIAQMLANAQAVTNAGTTFALTNGTTAGVGGFYGDVRKARNLLTTAAGVRLRASHIAAQDTFVDFLSAWNDAQGRPVFEPDGDPSGQGDGYAGFCISRVPVLADSNIPLSGSAVQVLVFPADTIKQLSGPPIFELLPQFQANNLEPLARLRQYCTTIPTYPTGIATISGSAGFYAASNFA